MPSSASAPPAIDTLSLHDALPIFGGRYAGAALRPDGTLVHWGLDGASATCVHSQVDGHTITQEAVPVPGLSAVVSVSFSFFPSTFRSEEHTSELQSLRHLVCRLLLRPPPPSTLFPYTTLFRSSADVTRVPRCARTARSCTGD